MYVFILSQTFRICFMLVRICLIAKTPADKLPTGQDKPRKMAHPECQQKLTSGMMQSKRQCA